MFEEMLLKRYRVLYQRKIIPGDGTGISKDQCLQA